VNHPDVPVADRSYLDGDEGAAYNPITLPPSPVQHATARLDSEFADFVLSWDGFQYGNSKVLVVEPFRAFETSLEIFERVGSPDSMANHICTSVEPSLASSGELTQGNSTPGPLLNGLGGWTATSLFYGLPLPLIPQWQIPPQPQFPHISQNMADKHPETIMSENMDVGTG
jgi:hypothetical protein